MKKSALALMLSALAPLAWAAEGDDYTRWLKFDKVAPRVWRTTCFNEIRNVDPNGQYFTRALIQQPYFAPRSPEGSGTVSRQSRWVKQSGNLLPWGLHWSYAATLRGRVLLQWMSFTFTMDRDFDVPDGSYVLCDVNVVNQATGQFLPGGRMLYYPR